MDTGNALLAWTTTISTNQPTSAVAYDGSIFVSDGYGTQFAWKKFVPMAILFDWGPRRKASRSGANLTLPHSVRQRSMRKECLRRRRSNARIQVFDSTGHPEGLEVTELAARASLAIGPDNLLRRGRRGGDLKPAASRPASFSNSISPGRKILAPWRRFAIRRPGFIGATNLAVAKRGAYMSVVTSITHARTKVVPRNLATSNLYNPAAAAAHL